MDATGLELSAALVDGSMGYKQLFLFQDFPVNLGFVLDYFKRLLICRKE